MTLSLLTSSSGIPAIEAPPRHRRLSGRWGSSVCSLMTSISSVSTKLRITPSYLMLSILRGLLDGLLEVPAYRHYLPDGLHRGPDVPRGPLELLGVPPRHLDDHVVEGGLEEGGRDSGDLVLQLRQGVAEAELGCDVGDGVTCGLRGKGRGPG